MEEAQHDHRVVRQPLQLPERSGHLPSAGQGLWLPRQAEGVPQCRQDALSRVPGGQYNCNFFKVSCQNLGLFEFTS